MKDRLAKKGANPKVPQTKGGDGKGGEDKGSDGKGDDGKGGGGKGGADKGGVGKGAAGQGRVLKNRMVRWQLAADSDDELSSSVFNGSGKRKRGESFGAGVRQSKRVRRVPLRTR